MKAKGFIVLPFAVAIVAVWTIAGPPPPPPEGRPPGQEAVEPLLSEAQPPPPDGQPPEAENQPPPPPPDGRIHQPGARHRRDNPGGTNEPAMARPRGHRGTNEHSQGRDIMSCRPMLKSVEEFKAQNPREFNRLMKLRKENPDAFRREVRERFGTNMKEKHPEAFMAHETERKNREQVRSLCRQYKTATNEAQKAVVETKVRTLLTETFDVKQQARQKELEMLQNRLKELQQSVEARAASKQETIEAQVKEMTQGQPASPRE